MKFSYDAIDEYQLEITTYCNAACPQCPRNSNGVGRNPHLILEHLPRKVIDQSFTKDVCTRLRQVFFCGSYGDAIMHPEFLDILRDFRKKSPTLWLYLHTNGGAHNQEYWQEIAKIMNGYGQIDFNIDGLENTNHLYRRGVNWSRLMENCKAFINAGGRAKWNYIVFQHNETEVDEAKKLSEQMGFADFSYRATGRFFNHQTIEEIPEWPVKNAEYTLKPTTLKEFQNRSVKSLPEIKKSHKSMNEYFNTTEIHCDALHGNKVAINAHGLVLPCNFFNHNLYDHRFFDETVLPSRNNNSNIDGKNQIKSIIEQFGEDNLNIKHKSLENIFQNPFWGYIVDSWKKPLGSGRIFECAMTCGSKFTKVWDQTK